MTQDHIFTDVDLDHSETFSFAAGSAAIFSAKNPEREGPNQDAAALIAVAPSSGVAVVSDGAGGHPSGAHAAAIAVRSVQHAINNIGDDPSRLREAIINGFETANQAILELGVGAASTLSVVEVQRGFMRTYHAGDSMILVTGQRGKIKWLTVPHSPVGYAVEAGFLDPGDALHHEDLHVVSNLIGRQDMRIEIGPAISIAARDTIVLASDGLSDNLHLDEIVERIRKGPLGKGANALADLGKRRMLQRDKNTPCKPDDLTFIALRPGKGTLSSAKTPTVLDA